MSSDRTRLVTVSASYGAGGSVVAPALAKRLGVPFLQRATTSTGGTAAARRRARASSGSCAEEADLTPAHRLLASLTQAMPVGPTQSPPSVPPSGRETCAGTARKASAAWRTPARG